MRIHSCQIVKTSQPSAAVPPCKDHLHTSSSTFSTPAAPPCKDNLDVSSTVSTPPEGPTCQQSSRNGIFSAEVTRNTGTHFKEAKQEDLNPGTIIVLDYEDSLHPERKDPTHRVPYYPEGHHKSYEGASTPSRRELSTHEVQEHKPRVRHYRKRVCVRWGSLQWSLALVLVVKSRSSTRLYQHRYQNNNLTSYTPLTVL